MKPLAGALLIIFAATAFGQTFGESYRIPGWGLSGKNRGGYFMALDREIKHGGQASITIRCDSTTCSQFGDIVQTIKADAYVGQRLKLSAWVRGSKAGRAALWMRVDAPNSQRLAFDSRGKGGTFDWRRIDIVLDVPPPASLILLGLILEGGGQAWLDDVTLEPVDKKVKATSTFSHPSQPYEGSNAEQKLYSKAPDHPVNLDLEQPVVPAGMKH